MKNYNIFTLCEELQSILDKEITVGNVITELPRCTDWPLEGKYFCFINK